MKQIFSNITQVVGNTPLVRLNKIAQDVPATILVKLEFLNPAFSIKDRIGIAMLDQAEKEKKIHHHSVIIEPTSGNTGIALAFACAAKGYRLILTMPDSMSIERQKLLKFLGAEVVLTQGILGMQGAIDKANALSLEIPHSFIPMQFENPANVDIHYQTTAQEIWRDTQGDIDVFVAGVGTGGTLTGVASFLKEKNSKIKIIALEPEESAVLSGQKAGMHQIQGIGAGFIPKILQQSLIDEVIRVPSKQAGMISRLLAKKEGILAGISSGANVWGALELAKRIEFKHKTIVTVLPSASERYLSTWLFEKTEN